MQNKYLNRVTEDTVTVISHHENLTNEQYDII